MEATKPKVSEDWLAVIIGVFILLLALAAVAGGTWLLINCVQILRL